MIEEKQVPELRFPEFSGKWEKKELREILEFKNGLNKGKEFFGSGTPIVNYMDVNKNKHLLNNDIQGLVTVNKSEKDRYRVERGDVFFTRTSETTEEIGLASVLIEDIKDCVYSGFILRGRNISQEVDVIFSGYLYNTENTRKEIMRKSSKTTRALTNGTLLSEVQVNLPSLLEQEKIGDFFYKIDKKIELQEAKIEELGNYKKSIVQRIFNEEVRFKDEDGKHYDKWAEKKIGELFYESSIKMKDIKNKKDYKELLSVTLYDGIKRQQDIGYSDTSNSDKSNYKIVNKYDIVYNSMRMWQGASGISDYNGIVSSAYVVLQPKTNVNPRFMSYYFKQKKSIYKFYRNSQGMTSDTLTLKYNLIKNITFLIPSIEEQEKITNLFTLLDQKIDLENIKLEKYKEYKKALMQRMFI